VSNRSSLSASGSTVDENASAGIRWYFGVGLHPIAARIIAMTAAMSIDGFVIRPLSVTIHCPALDAVIGLFSC
jgi:hypothetical protein